MEKSSIVKMSVGASIIVIMIAAFMIPVIQASETNARTTAQNAGELFSMSDDAETVLDLTKSAGSDDTYLNGVLLAKKSGIILTSANIDIREQSDGQLFIVDLQNDRWGQYGTQTAINIHVENNILTWTVNNTTSYTVNIEGHFFYIDGAGEWGGFYNNLNITKDTSAYLVFYPIYGGGQWSAFATYEIKNGEISSTIAAPVRHTSSGWTPATNVILNIGAESMAGYDAYSYSTMATDNLSERNGEYIAPLEYQYISTMDSAVISMLDLMPVLIVIGLILSIVGAVVVSRFD